MLVCVTTCGKGKVALQSAYLQYSTYAPQYTVYDASRHGVHLCFALFYKFILVDERHMGVNNLPKVAKLYK